MAYHLGCSDCSYCRKNLCYNNETIKKYKKPQKTEIALDDPDICAVYLKNPYGSQAEYNFAFHFGGRRLKLISFHDMIIRFIYDCIFSKFVK